MVQHLFARQWWVQEGLVEHGIRVHNFVRDINETRAPLLCALQIGFGGCRGILNDRRACREAVLWQVG